MRTDNRWSEQRLTLCYILIVGAVVALYRLMPYLLGPDMPFGWNLVPIGALALFIGSRLRTRYAWLLPLGVMLVSDLMIAVPLALKGYSAFSLVETPIIYASYAIYVALGRMIRQNELSPAVLGGAALLAGAQFFLLTNFAVWLRGGLYPMTLEGLGACYLAGLPYYRNTIAGDLIFSVLIFGAHAGLLWLLDRQPGPALQSVGERWHRTVRDDRSSVTRRDEVRR
jgi:hypothetical protein